MTNDMRPVRLLLVDDTATVHQTVVAMLGRGRARRPGGRAYEVDLLQTVEAGAAAIRAGSHDCYLVDHHVGPASGVEMIRGLRAEGVTAPIIMLTGSSGEVEGEAAEAGANDFLVKGGFDTPTLERAIRYAIGNAETLRRVADTAAFLEEQVAERTRQHVETNARLLEQIAARERAEAALLRASTLEALGRMTGQVAHDFNNVLTALFGSLEALGERLGPDADPRLLRSLFVAREAARRGERMMDGLLAFARRRPIAPERLDCNAVIAAAGDVLRAASEPAHLREALDPGPLQPIEADLDQFERALANLVSNARDALAGRPDPHVTISTAAEPGHVRVSVADNGPGMTPDVLARAFEPLFSTKDGRGTGLGLAQVYGFVQSSGGTVSIDNRPGEGLTVTMRLPVAAES